MDLEAARHSLAHVLAAAVGTTFGGVKYGVGPVIEHGFYYDFDLPATISAEELPKIEQAMHKIIADDLPFERLELSIEEARQQVTGQPYKRELLEQLIETGNTAVGAPEPQEPLSADAKITFYKIGDFVDLCRGGHVESTGKVAPFRLDRVSGAYWRGDEKNQQMQRVYGVAFATLEEVDAYFKQREEAKARDHRKLGQQMDLFTFSDLVGPGLPLFTPRGTTIRRLLAELMRQAGQKFGALEVEIPHVAKKELYETSGHAQKFAHELFEVKSHYDVEFVLKPVNCPHHTQIYAARPRSYRDLPLHYMETTVQYRDEKPGQLGGLQRTRGFKVDDGHIFLTREQLPQAINDLFSIVKEVHSGVGMYGQHWVSLSLRDPATPEKYIGDETGWEEAEASLRQISEQLGLNAKEMPGEAALYGPKLDFMYQTVGGTETQLATIQLDFATPTRFGLVYTDEHGQEQAPIMIHRAILGSIERFMVILLEQTNGHLPFWLAPEQVRILTINDTVSDYVGEVKEVLASTVLMQPIRYNEIRSSVDDRNESLGKKIREGETEKVPVLLIVGPKDLAAREVSMRTGAGESKVKLDQLSTILQTVQ